MTGNGRLRRAQAIRQHLSDKKPSTRTRRLAADADVHSGDEKKIKRLLAERDAGAATVAPPIELTPTGKLDDPMREPLLGPDAFEGASTPVTAAPLQGGRADLFALYPPRPNPSWGMTRIAWVQPRRARTTVRVTDVSGRVVRALVDRVTDGGEHEAEWDGRNRSGERVAAGAYFVRVESGGQREARRFVRLR